ncbi:MAG: malonyl-CoA decarboxylase [Gammaproteobacteria bacterium]|nr:malonyl-CoA decarboxylase [Gammaproteobacteria bacterium]
MKAISIKNLARKLSSLGLESLGNLYSKNNDPKTEQIGNLCNALLELKGEASSIALAEEILAAYSSFNQEEKIEFLLYLETDLAPDKEKVDFAISEYQDNPVQTSIQALHDASESRRLGLFRALNMAPKGIESLITMREDILNALKMNSGLSVVDNDLLHLFRSWFNRGFLEIKRIDLETPALVLEKLIQYELVHEIEDWSDLHRRLEEDRRCFGFFHPVMPYEPLIFVEVALTDEISRNVSELLKEEVNSDNGNAPTTAIFYSINNCLKGLRGVSFGNLLIKQVVEKLEREISSIKTYATLSPLPGFNNWLENELDNLEFLDDSVRGQVKAVLAQPTQELLTNAKLKKILLSLCAYYLLKIKSRNKPSCPVARFHLGNGATLDSINWLADKSENGLKQSTGMMVNYIYDKSTLARNHEVYEQDNAIVCAAEVRQLLP